MPKKPIPRKKQIGRIIAPGKLQVSIKELEQMKAPRPKTFESGGFSIIEGKGYWKDPILKDRRKKEGAIKDRKK